MYFGDGAERFDRQVEHVICETAGRCMGGIGLPASGFDAAVTVDTEVTFRMQELAERARAQTPP